MMTEKKCLVCDRSLPATNKPGGRPKMCSDECRRRRNRESVDRYINRKREERRATSGVVRCRVCGKDMEVITPLHLALHGMTLAEYRVAHPDADLMCEGVRRTRAKGMDSRRLYLSYEGQVPDQRLFSFLCGSLLGDGSLEAKRITARYGEGGANQLYLRHKANLLTEYFPTTFTHRVSKRDKRTGKEYEGWWLRTAGHPLLKEWHARWYAPQKVVPTDIVERHLDGHALAIWFYDDGHLGCDNNAYLYPMAFTAKEAGFLSKLLIQRFSIENKIRFNDRDQPILYMGGPGRQTLLDTIRQFPMPGMAYKLGEP